MPDKSRRKDKNEGTVDKTKGRVKDATGSLTRIRARSRKRRVLQKTF